MNRKVDKVMKGNTPKNKFGPDWRGQTCGAITRSGTPCKRPARKTSERCKLHGGASAGPTSLEGLCKVKRSRTSNGLYVSEKRIEAKRRAKIGREVTRQIQDVESWALEMGLLKKNWSEFFR